MSTFSPCPLLRAATLVAVLAAPLTAAVTPADLSARMTANEKLVIVDVRSPHLYEAGHIPGAINIPLALLPYKPLPAGSVVVLYGDGLGVVDESQALAAARGKPAVTADVLAGGYSQWLAETRLSTQAPGASRERIAGITYDQLVASGKGDMVLVDLRDATAPAHAMTDASQPAAAAAPVADLVGTFARKLGVPVVSATPAGAKLRVKAQRSGDGTPAPAAVDSLDEPGRLLVLVADDEAVANDAARQLRARGIYRFTILIGGTEAIRREGKVGSGRMSGGTYAGQTAP